MSSHDSTMSRRTAVTLQHFGFALIVMLALPACGEDQVAAGPGSADAAVTGTGADGTLGTADGTVDNDGATGGTDAAINNEDGDSGGSDGAIDDDGSSGGSDGAIDDDGDSSGSDGAIDDDGGSGGSDGAIDDDGSSGGTDGAINNDDGCSGCTDGVINNDDGGSGGTDGAVNNDDGGSGGTDGAINNDDSCSGCTDGVNNNDDGGSGGTDGLITNDDGGSGGTDGTATGADADAGADTGATCLVDKDCAGGAAAPCTTDLCVGGKCQVVWVTGGGCDDGDSCTSGDACIALGKCAGAAKVCDDGNPCTADACAAGACTANATANACDDGNACTSGDACKDGACQPGALADCDDKNACSDDSCGAASGCAHANNAAACNDGSACTAGEACKDGKCAGGAAVACDDSNACTTDACDPQSGLCQFAAAASGVPCEDGDACTTADGCGNGKCKGGPAKVCDDANPCTDDSCDKTAGCVATPNTVGCDDGNACTASDLCKAGACAGAASKCDDANPCTDDGCDPKVGCTKTNNTAACDGGDLCVSATCAAGACVPGAKKNCDDSNACTTDSCDAKKGCVNANAADGAQCLAGDACVAASTCGAGKCNAGAKANCDDGNLCTTDACDAKTGCMWSPNTSPCDDGNACTIGDLCGVVAGKGPSCVAGKPIDAAKCDDANGCTTDACDPKAGCVHANNTIACDDSNVCTTGDACSGGKCVGGGAAGCSDGNPCTVDNCDAKTGACSWSAGAGPCEDGSACTLGDACATGKCVPGVAKACDDGNVCTTDSCDPKTGGCTTTTNTSPCDDGSLCTKPDSCSVGKCVGAPGVNCDDANACTNDACDNKTGTCSHANNTALCSDNNACTTGDVCAGGACKAGTQPSCDDASSCTLDTCDAASGKCSHAPANEGAACDDGIACTLKSTCETGVCAPTAACVFVNEAFACGGNSGWTIVTPPSPYGFVERKTMWKVDMAPAVGTSGQQVAHQCTMNFNNDKNTCDGYKFGGQNYCLPPAGTAKTPVIDWTTLKAGQGVPLLLFDAYYDVDVSPVNNPADQPQIIVRDATSGNVLSTSWLDKSPQFLKVWRNAVTLDMSAAVGHAFTVEFSLYEPNVTYFTGEQGAGFFVDNVKVEVGFAKLLWDDMDCADKGWTNQSTDNNVKWAVDQTPSGAKAYTGTCTLNYNNGTDYNVQSGNGALASSGFATWAQTIDATGYSDLILQFAFYFDTDATLDNDVAWLQVSTDGFAGCGTNNNCASINTLSYRLDKTGGTGTAQLKKWFGVTWDLQYFAGKKFQVRFRFDTINGSSNSHPGVFIDDVHLTGIK